MKNIVDKKLEALGLEITVTQSEEDSQVIVFIDTPDEEIFPCNEKGPTGFRVYLNGDIENPLWGEFKCKP